MQIFRLIAGDSFKVLSGMPEGSIGAVVSDPPYGLEFQGADWDKLDVQAERAGFTSGGSDRFAKSQLPSFTGGSPNFFCANCGGSMRGQDRVGFTRCRCDNPSFPDQSKYRIDQARAMQEWHIVWLKECFRVLHPEGIIKAFGATRTFHRLGKAMEAAGFKIVGCEAWTYGSGFPKSLNIGKALDKSSGSDPAIDTVVSEAAKKFEGYGTALKPAWEPFLVGRKPT